MGLLISSSAAENQEAAEIIYCGVASVWARESSSVWGVEYREFSKRSISRICLLGEHIFNDEALPREPGPFKRAAAFCILTQLFLSVDIRALQGADFLTLNDRRDWLSRLALSTIPGVLSACEVELGGRWVRLTKEWVPATIHLRLEMLNWLRWLVKPIEGDTKVSLARLNRMVLALSMVIEQSYYISGNHDVITCDVMNRGHECMQSVVKDERALIDLLSATSLHRSGEPQFFCTACN